MSLSPKQARFVAEYLLDLNATAAAKRAGYSAKRAAEQGYQLLQKTTVQEAIAQAQKARSKRTRNWPRSVSRILATSSNGGRTE